MTVSQLVQHLENYIETYGDMDVVVYNEKEEQQILTQVENYRDFDLDPWIKEKTDEVCFLA